jgi:hypothetical protein
VREVDRTNGLLRSPFCPDSLVISEFYIEGTEPVSQCSGVFGAPEDSTRAAPPAPFGQQQQPFDPNAIRPHAAPAPAPARPPTHPPTHDTVRGPIDPFHPTKP